MLRKRSGIVVGNVSNLYFYTITKTEGAQVVLHTFLSFRILFTIYTRLFCILSPANVLKFQKYLSMKI